MSNPLPFLTDEQVQASLPTDDDTGFGSLATERGHLPLVAMDVQARIDGRFSQVDLRPPTIGPLPTSGGEAARRFPLVAAPRPMPGSPLPRPPVGRGTASDTDAVPDASRITPPVLLPGYPNPVRLSLTIEIRSAG